MVAARILGALAGGALRSKHSLYQALMVFGILAGDIELRLLAARDHAEELRADGRSHRVENLCGGLGTAAFVAFLMALTDVRLLGAQYALVSALAAIGRVYVGQTSGVLVENFGWPTISTPTVIAALTGLLLKARAGLGLVTD